MRYLIEGPVWVHAGAGGWRFVTIDRDVSRRLRAMSGPSRGWGSIRVNATLAGHHWATSIFPDSKSETFVLPLKADVRRKTGTADGDVVAIELEIAL